MKRRASMHAPIQMKRRMEIKFGEWQLQKVAIGAGCLQAAACGAAWLLGMPGVWPGVVRLGRPNLSERLQTSLNRCVPVGRGWRFPLAAPLRGWHIHASALVLHSLAASVFSRAQARVGKRAGHRRNEQRHQNREDEYELARRFHPGTSIG